MAGHDSLSFTNFPVLNVKVQKNDINQFILLKQKVLCRWIFVTLHPDN